MWPLISSARISSAWAAASSGVSANLTPPAFMRPPVSTCDLTTVGAPMSCAMRRASSAEVAKPCGEVGMPALATIFRDSYSKNLMGCGSLSWGRMRFALACFVVLLLPGSASAADLSLTLASGPGVQYGTAHELDGTLREGTAPLAGQTVQLEGRAYPYDGAYRKLATATTRADGGFAFQRRFDRNMDLRAIAPAQEERSSALRATQFLRTAPNVRLTARSTFYLGPENARSAPPMARAKPRRISPGRFKATATVRLPRAWKGSFRYGSCFRYSKGSGMGAPGVTCPKRYRF